MASVVYVGNWRPSHSTETHVGLSLESLGHQVTRLQEDEVIWREVPRIAAQVQADVFLWTRTWSSPMDEACAALERLRYWGIPTVGFHLDRWWGLDREYQVESEPFFRCQWVFTADGGSADRWEQAGVNHRWLPPGVFHAECDPVPANRRLYPEPIVFVGSHPYGHAGWQPYRTELLTRLQHRYRRQFRIWPRPRQPIRGARLQTLYATAKVVVGDSCLVGEPAAYWSDRTPETLGRGGFLIHPKVVGMDDWYADERDLCFYTLGDWDGLFARIDWALSHPRERSAIAERGRRTVLSRDTYRHRMQTVLAEVLG